MKVIYFDISQETFNVCLKLNGHGFDLKFTNQSLNQSSMALCNDMDVLVLLTQNYEFNPIILSNLQKMGIRLIIVTQNTKKNIDFNLINSQSKIKVAQVEKLNNELFNFTVLNSVLNLLFNKNNNFLVQQNAIQKNIVLIGENELSKFLDNTLRNIGFKNIFYFNHISNNKDSLKHYLTWEDLIKYSDLISIQENCFKELQWINQKFISMLKPNICIVNNAFDALHNWDSVKNSFLINSNFKYVCNFIDSSNNKDFYDLKNVAMLNKNQFSLNLVSEFLTLNDFEKCITKINEIVFTFGTTARTKAIIDK